MRVSYVDGPRLRRSLVAACEYAQARRQDLNRINVFPVPDGDTGTNLALTVRAIADRLRASAGTHVGDVAHEAAQASVLGARGNCGMMLSHFLIGFSGRLRGVERMKAEHFGEALTAGVAQLQEAIERPVEGTILTVMRDTAEAARTSPASDFVPLLESVLEAARRSLARTPDLLPVLRQAGVVDAGAKGFVNLLEGIVGFMQGDPLTAVEDDAGFADVSEAIARIEFPVQEESYRFCTEALVRGPDLPGAKEVRVHLADRGDSLVVIRSDDVLKLHIHTDEPEEVFGYLRALGTLVTHKAEDMRVQHEAMERNAGGHVTLARRPVAIVTDSAADLPTEVVQAHGIHVVPLLLVSGDRVERDRVDVTADEYTRRMLAGEPLPTTSQPPPGAFLEAYRRAAEDAESIVVVALGSALSGTMHSAQAAAKVWAEEATEAGRPSTPVTVLDTHAASSLQALLAVKAAELGELGRGPEEIGEELALIRSRSGIFFTVDTFDRLLASGRVGKGRAWLGTLLGVKPILGLTTDGKVIPVGKALGRDRVIETALDLVRRAVPEGATVRFALAHVACESVIERVAEELRRRYGRVDILMSPATPVVATHVGPGAWALAYMVESD